MVRQIIDVIDFPSILIANKLPTGIVLLNTCVQSRASSLPLFSPALNLTMRTCLRAPGENSIEAQTPAHKRPAFARPMNPRARCQVDPIQTSPKLQKAAANALVR